MKTKRCIRTDSFRNMESNICSVIFLQTHRSHQSESIICFTILKAFNFKNIICSWDITHNSIESKTCSKTIQSTSNHKPTRFKTILVFYSWHQIKNLSKTMILEFAHCTIFHARSTTPQTCWTTF